APAQAHWWRTTTSPRPGMRLRSAYRPVPLSTLRPPTFRAAARSAFGARHATAPRRPGFRGLIGCGRHGRRFVLPWPPAQHDRDVGGRELGDGELAAIPHFRLE